MKKRFLSAALVLALCLSLLPPVAFAAEPEDPGLCPHHTEHTAECGYAEPAGDDPEGAPCTYECPICPVQDLIDALPQHVTGDNRDAVTEQLQEILSLYAALDEAEQEQLDLAPAVRLQEELDGANAAMPLAEEYTISSGNITINSSNKSQYDGATVTGTTTNTHITIDGTEVSLTIKDLSIQLPYNDGSVGNLMHAGIQLENNATLHLTLEGANTIQGGNMEAGIGVPAGCSLIITEASSGSLTATGGSGAAGIGAAWSGTTTNPGTVGSITINGGSISAKGSNGGAGIGGTNYGTTGSVTINGGTVYAAGSANSIYNSLDVAAGIGGGREGCLSSITITGGTVTAEGATQSTSQACSSAIGAGYSASSCGAIQITGGTVNAKGKNNYAIGLTNKSGSGSVTIGENAAVNLNGGNINPAPPQGTSYTINGSVYDASLTGNRSATLTLNNLDYDVTVGPDASQPLYGRFSVKLFIASSTLSNASLKIGETTYTAAPQVSGSTVSFTFGQQDYRYGSLNVTVYDTAITGDMPVTLTCGDASWSGTMVKSQTEPYCGSVTAGNLTFSKTDSILPLTVRYGSKTWSQDVAIQETMDVTFGQQEYAYYTLKATVYDESITEDQSVQVTIGGNSYDTALHKTAEYCGEFQLTGFILPLEEKDNTTAVTVKLGSTTRFGTASTGIDKTLTVGTPILPAEFTLDISKGSIQFSAQNGKNQVTYYEEVGGEQKTSVLPSLDAVYEVIQSEPSTATENQLLINLSGVHVRIRDVNMSSSKNPIKISGEVTLETAGSNTVQTSEENSAAVQVPDGSKLKLTGNGSLDARSTNTDYGGTGIGSDWTKTGAEITILSGTVTAQGGKYAAGIGGGDSTVTIYDGSVTATGGEYGGAGIGGGNNGSGEVTITGGTVTATGGDHGAGIGGGNKGSGKVTITGGTVTATGGDSYGAGIGGGNDGAGDVTIAGGRVTATGGSGGAGIGGGDGGAGTVTISGGTINATGTPDTAAGIGGGRNKSGAVTITGGTIKASSVSAPQDASGNSLSLKEITLEGVGDGQLIDQASGFGKDVYTRDGGKLYFYVVSAPESVTVAGTKYLPEDPDSANYIPELNASLTGYDTEKVYDGKPLQNPTAAQLGLSSADGLTFQWYQDGTPLADEPVNVGDYLLRVSQEKARKDFNIKITARPLEISAKEQTIEYNGQILTGMDQVESGDLADEEVLAAITLSTAETSAGTHTGAIAVSDAVIKRSGKDVTANYNITYTPGDLTIKEAAAEVTTWPTASVIRYGQKLSDSTLTGGTASPDGIFAWKAPDTMPQAVGTAEYEVVFTPSDNNYGEVSKDIPVTVDQAELTITAKAQEITYGDSISREVNEVEVTAGALAAGDRLTEIALTTSDDQVAAAGKTITPSGAQIENGNGENVTAYYTITYQTGDLTIRPKEVNAPVIELALPEAGYVYDGEAKTPKVTVKSGSTTIPESEYTVEYLHNVSAGQATVTITDNPDGNYTVSGAESFPIAKSSLEDASVKLDKTEYTYDGAPKAPAVTVEKDGRTVNPGEYEISFSNTNGGSGDRTHAGTVTVTVTAKEDGNYSGSGSAAFTIVPKQLIPSIGGQRTKTYDGNVSAPGAEIELEGVLDSDNVTATATFSYNSPNVKDADAITATDIALAGNDAGNYTLSETEIKGEASITKDESAAAPGDGEGYTIDYTAETIAVEEGYEVSSGRTEGTTIAAGGSISDDFGKPLFIHKVEDDNHAASDWTEFRPASRPAAPDLEPIPETWKGKADGALPGVTDEMTYRVDNGDWKDGPADDLTGLAGGTKIEVYLKATDSAPHGESAIYEIKAGDTITATFLEGDQPASNMPEAQTGLCFHDKVTKPSDPTAKDTDYAFVGWYKDEEGSDAWEFDQDAVTEDVTLYAQWKRVKFDLSVIVMDNSGTAPVEGAGVAIKKGSQTMKEGLTDGSGAVSLTSVPIGVYNAVITKGEQTKTSLVTIEDKDVDLTVTLPPLGANSTLTVTGEDTPDVVVGGLDDEAARMVDDPNVEKVTVSMEIAAKPETQAEGAEEIKKAAEAASNTSVALEYLDVAVKAVITKQDTSSETETLTHTNTVMELAVPFDFKGKTEIKVYRYHDGKAEAFTAASEANPVDGTYKADEGNGLICIYTNQFSTYAIGYTVDPYTVTFNPNGGTVSPTSAKTGTDGRLESLPVPTRGGDTFQGWYLAEEGGAQVTADTIFEGDTTVYAHWTANSSSGGPGVSKYAVTVAKPDHGEVRANLSRAAAGTTVTLTVTPDEGYALKALNVTDAKGNEPALTDKGGGEYSFTMPGAEVTVKAVFAQKDGAVPCDGGENCPSRGFTDLGPVDVWYHEAVDYVLRTGLMGGYGDGRFGPDDKLSRAQLAQILYNRAGQPAVTGTSPFTDVEEGAWYTDAILWASGNSIVNGYGGGSFGPDDPITREELAVMLWRQAGSPPSTGTLDGFADGNTAGAWAVDALRWAVEQGILNGYGGGILDPTGPTARAQAAAMLMRCFNNTLK